MIVYRLVNGIAHDIRAEKDTYALKNGESSRPGFDLPKVEEVSDPTAVEQHALDNTQVSVEDVLNLLAERGLIKSVDITAIKQRNLKARRGE